MTDQPFPDEGRPSEDGPDPSPAWEAPEVAGVAVLVSIGILVAGGLVTGIARSIAMGPFEIPGTNLQDTWNAIQFGAQWASPVLAALLLGVLGLCWWQRQAWTELIEAPDSDDELSEARGHIGRAHRMALAAQVALGITAAGSVAAFVAALGANAGLPGPNWTVDIYGGASMLAVLTLSAAGIGVGRRLDHPANATGGVLDPPG